MNYRFIFLRKNVFIFYGVLLLNIFNPLYAISSLKDKGDRETVFAMIERLMPGKSDFFILKNIPGDGRDSFHIESQNKKILVEGTNALAMAKGVSYYLKNYCHTSVSWYASDQIILPKILPEVTKPAGEVCRFENRFFMNYCTAGYTTLWWKWNDWQRLIDGMALNGINRPLAIQGQEYIWQKVWRKFGMTDKQILAFFTGHLIYPGREWAISTDF